MQLSREWERWDDPGVAEEIDRYWTTDPTGYESVYRSILAELVKAYSNSPLDRVLEVGCGSGLIYQTLVPELILNSNYVGVDISTEMLRLARQRFSSGQFIRDDIYNLHFPDNSFDLVLCFEVLSHLPDIQKPISEMLRVATRAFIFTVWVSPDVVTQTRAEQFRESKFLHRQYAHSEIMATIRQVASGTAYRIETRPLSDMTWAYIIHKDQSVSPNDAVIPFPGLTERMMRHYTEMRARFEIDSAQTRNVLTTRESELAQARETLAAHDLELAQAREALAARNLELAQAREASAARDLELAQVRETLAARDLELAQVRETLAAHDLELAQVREMLVARDSDLNDQRAELMRAREMLKARALELDQTQTFLANRNAELRQVQLMLAARETELAQTRNTLAARDTALEQTRANTQAREDQLARVRAKGAALANELAAFRHRRINRWLDRLTNRADAAPHLAPAFLQLKDDSYIFTRDLTGYLLQPSDDLRRVEFVYYPLDLDRANLRGILLAAIFDFPPAQGALGIEIVSPANQIVAQVTRPANEINDAEPVRFDFAPLRDSNQGRFWLRVFVRDADAPIRIFEWRKYAWFGLGRLRTRAFCGFVFE
jgi:ubiquinone/menaquinone biosynthesis C-methylase UbiE